jgi:hypothetical protein
MPRINLEACDFDGLGERRIHFYVGDCPNAGVGTHSTKLEDPLRQLVQPLNGSL